MMTSNPIQRDKHEHRWLPGSWREVWCWDRLYLHNFEYEQAAWSFQRAQKIDPEFVMAYWGEAMTHNHPIWLEQDREAAVVILERLGATASVRASTAPTIPENTYLEAVETLYGLTQETRGLAKDERDIRYRDIMRHLHETYPTDHEARAFYGLSMLGVSRKNRTVRAYVQAAATLMPVWDANHKHPGTAHYVIHAFDDSDHAPLGLPMARAYSKIAPAAAHA